MLINCKVLKARTRRNKIMNPKNQVKMIRMRSLLMEMEAKVIMMGSHSIRVVSHSKYFLRNRKVSHQSKSQNQIRPLNQILNMIYRDLRNLISIKLSNHLLILKFLLRESTLKSILNTNLINFNSGQINKNFLIFQVLSQKWTLV